MKRILITGASSGIGLVAARLLACSARRLILCCRTNERIEQTRRILIDAGADGCRVDGVAMDLADLGSVERGCQQLLDQGIPLDVLVLNAGLQRAGDPTPARSAQGIELTFAVNQLAHQLMAMRLLPLLRQASQPRLVITASDVHDPRTGGGRVGQSASLGDLKGLLGGPAFVMVDGSPRFDGDKAYKDSKLCNVLMGRELARRLDEVMPVIAWSPGLVIPRGDGGFFHYNRQRNPLGMALFSLLARDLLRLSESVDHAGGLLAELSTADAFSSAGFSYMSNRLVRPALHRFAAVETSPEGADPLKAAKLWRGCEQLIETSLSG